MILTTFRLSGFPQADLLHEHTDINHKQNINKSNPMIYKRITHRKQVGIILAIQGWFDICESVHVIHHSNNKKGG